MSLPAPRFADLKRALAFACDRLVHPSVVDAEARGEQRRVMGLLLAGPFFLSAAAWILLPASIGSVVTFGLMAGTFCLCGILALVLGASRNVALTLPVVLLLGAAHFALFIAGAGGLSSPVALLAAALPAEAWLATRNRQTLGMGFAAMLGCLVLQAIFSNVLPVGGSPTAWHWLLPLAYAGLVLPRMKSAALQESGTVRAPSQPETDEDRIEVRLAPGGELADIASSARDLLGVDPDLLIGTGLFDRIHVADRVGFLCALADLREGAARRKVEVRLRLPASGEQPSTRYRPLVIEMINTGTEKFTGFIRDNAEIAELRDALAAAREANAGLEVAKSRFLAAVSHELRTPLNSIIGFSDMLLCEVHGSFSDPRQKEHLQIVREAGNHLLGVVNSILDVSKIEAGAYATTPEPFRFDEAATFCHGMVRLQAESKQIRIVSDVPVSTGEVNADRRAVQQMLINLLSNAIKFTPSGGEVRLSAKRIGSRLHFWVKDNGIGIAEDDLKRIGEPFAQVQNDYTRHFEGTGLGLALVKGLVALHEGTMSIDSELGKGTKVTITLPIQGPGGAQVQRETATLRLPTVSSGVYEYGALRKAS
ncbi:sensor histidine kinase [Pseudaminobacter soli (ex Zhang et al. 2022)]|nr:HAMP domain-containing sensor histidine kinase [Pseudaminobacter soli]